MCAIDSPPQTWTVTVPEGFFLEDVKLIRKLDLFTLHCSDNTNLM